MIVGSATIVVNAMTTPFVNQVNRSMQAINGRAGGSAFGSAFSRGATKGMGTWMAKSTEMYKSINRLIEVGYTMQTAFIGLAGVVGATAGGLFAFGSAVGSAAPSMFVLVGVMTAAVSAMITMKVAMGGLGALIGKLWKGTTGAANSQARANAIYDAQLRISRLTEDYVEKKIKSNERIKQAEEKLIKVRETAIEQLQQLNFKAQDAAIGEKKAGIELEKAREALARVQDLPPNSRVRREAELAYAEAELNLRKAKDANKDLAKESTAENAKFAAKGVEGLQDVIDATKDVQEAKDEQAKMERDHHRSMMDAEKQLERAKEKGGAGGGDNPYKDMSKEAIDFANLVVSLKENFLALKYAAGKELFPKMGEALKILVREGFPTFRKVLQNTGSAIGDFTIKIAEAITEKRNLDNLLKANDTVNDTIRKSGDLFRNLYTIMLELLTAADPLIRRFTEWMVTLTGGWAETLRLKNESGELTEMFNKAGDVAAQLGDIIGNLIGTIMNMGKAAVGPGSGGQSLLDGLEAITLKWKNFTGSVEGKNKLREYFIRASDIFKSVVGFLADIIKFIIKIGDSQGMKDFVEGFRKGIGHIGEALQKVSGSGNTGIFGQFIENMGKVIAFTIESGAVQVYFGILVGALELLVRILENPAIGKIIGILAVIHGARLGFSRVATVVTGFAKYVTGAVAGVVNFAGSLAALPMKMMNGMLKLPLLGTMMTNLAGVFSTMGLGTVPAFAAAFLTIVGVIAAVVAIFILCYNNSKIFRDSLADLWQLIKDHLMAGFEKIKDALKEVGFTIGNVSGVFKTLGDFLGTYIVPIIGVIIVNAIGILVDGIIGLIKIVAGIIDIFKAVWDFIMIFWNLFTGKPDEAFKSLISMFRNLMSGIGKIFGGVFDILVSPFKLAFNLIADLWNNTIGKWGFTVPGWVPIIGGKSFTMPKISKWGGTEVAGKSNAAGGVTKMAKGGIVYPTQYGTVVRVAEAGRPERIEPLDADGLSKRDRAIMTANAGNIYITVNPAAGMNEAELASMVSRQLAWQLRKGVA